MTWSQKSLNLSTRPGETLFYRNKYAINNKHVSDDFISVGEKGILCIGVILFINPNSDNAWFVCDERPAREKTGADGKPWILVSCGFNR